MTETEPEDARAATAEPEPGAEALTDPESPDGAADAQTADGEPTGGDVTDPETGDVTEPAGLRDEKELDRAFEKVRREHDRHENRVREIVGADFDAMAPCPLCSHFATGYIGLVELPDSAIPVLRAMLGMPDLSNLEDAADARKCPSCNGKGLVKTGSDVPGYESKQCASCVGTGWLGEGPRVPAPSPGNGPVPVMTGPTAYEDTAGDPQVAALRERGFTVIPPMRVEP